MLGNHAQWMRKLPANFFGMSNQPCFLQTLKAAESLMEMYISRTEGMKWGGAGEEQLRAPVSYVSQAW